jgi:hypothetical protein
MTVRTSDTAVTIAAIGAIVIVIIGCLCAGIDETIIKAGLAVIAALAGFSARGLIR